MIEKTDSLEILNKNIQRTEMLIEAMDKIKAYNSIYQMDQTDPEYVKLIRKVQDEQLMQIEISCAEHAIISLTTTFETYCKELVQQLIQVYPQIFLSKATEYANKIKSLIEDPKLHTYESIFSKLSINNRFDFFSILKTYGIPFLSNDEKTFIEYIYALRNSYVHNAGKSDAKTLSKLSKVHPPFNETALRTEAKKLRTKFNRLFSKVHERVFVYCDQIQNQQIS